MGFEKGLKSCAAREADNQLCIANDKCNCESYYKGLKMMDGIVEGSDYEIRDTGKFGKGLFTLKEIPPKRYLMHYSGEYIRSVCNYNKI